MRVSGSEGRRVLIEKRKLTNRLYNVMDDQASSLKLRGNSAVC